MNDAAIDTEQSLRIAQYCSALVIAAADATDRRAFDELAALFTPEARLYRPTARGEPLTGREAIKASYEAKPASRLTRHFCSPPHVLVESAYSARARTYAQVFGADTEKSDRDETFGYAMDARQIVGEFDDRFEYIDGLWLIAERHARFVLHR